MLKAGIGTAGARTCEVVQVGRVLEGLVRLDIELFGLVELALLVRRVTLLLQLDRFDLLGSLRRHGVAIESAGVVESTRREDGSVDNLTAMESCRTFSTLRRKIYHLASN